MCHQHPGRCDEEEKEKQRLFEDEREKQWRLEQFETIIANSPTRGYARSAAQRLEIDFLSDDIEKHKQVADLDKLLEAAECLAAERGAQAQALIRRRDEVLLRYKDAAAREAYLIRLLKLDPENRELQRDRDEAGRRADSLYREYQSLC